MDILEHLKAIGFGQDIERARTQNPDFEKELAGLVAESKRTPEPRGRGK